MYCVLLLAANHRADDVGVSRVGDGEGANTVVATAGSAEVNVVAVVVVNTALGEHGVVLNLGLADRGDVVGDEDHLGLASPEGLEGGLVAEVVLARLHDEGETAVDALLGLLLLLGDHLREVRARQRKSDKREQNKCS